MGQKVHPIGYRLGVSSECQSRWYADKKNYAKKLHEDIKLRKYIMKKWEGAGISRIEIEAQLVADGIASSLERRVSFRRAMKQAIFRATKAGVKGIKAQVAGRLGGAEIARTEWYNEGQLPLSTIKADIDYGFAEAKTIYGIIGCKVWIYRDRKNEKAAAPARPARNRPANKGA